ncbi:MAG: putative T-complex protein 1 subunit zeta [Streblomastix strix]|uniref:Putative T-complex protein 1 subunit zeta n=1 Tax=Streblomastix strix TaxID=222440 RepID=A0A5J4VCM4_9EUKA|nr:MAG: putative T-complex protein 1 subunit zeta [Streblomastix strix]
MAISVNKALLWNISQAKGLQEVLRSNIGPTGTMKMLVSGGGDIRITKDGARLLSEMQIQLPTAQLIARSATAIDDEYGDGTSSVCILTAEILKLCEAALMDGSHPRVLVEGIKKGCSVALGVLDRVRTPLDNNMDLVRGVIRSSLLTKLPQVLAEQLTDICTESVSIVKKQGEQIDLHMIEIMHMQHKLATETVLIRGLVLDHGGRHPDMPHELFNCYILTCNVSLEYEKTEVNSSFAFATPEQREALVRSERKLTDERVLKIVELKRKLCTKENGKTLVVINQKGIDPISLDLLAKDGILGLRRAKKRNMERLVLACGGNAVNTVDELKESDLGHAEHVYEQVLGEDKFTFVEVGEKEAKSCTILVKGSTTHLIGQIKDALRDGLRAAKNAYDDNAVIAGGGAFELAAHNYLIDTINKRVGQNESIKGIKDIVESKADEASAKVEKALGGKLSAGMKVFADSLLVIPKLIAVNSGFDALTTIAKLNAAARSNVDEEQIKNKNKKDEGITNPFLVGIDVDTGEPVATGGAGKRILDNVCVKRQILLSASVIASQLLLVDDVLSAGKAVKQNTAGLE